MTRLRKRMLEELGPGFGSTKRFCPEATFCTRHAEVLDPRSRDTRVMHGDRWRCRKRRRASRTRAEVALGRVLARDV